MCNIKRHGLSAWPYMWLWLWFIIILGTSSSGGNIIIKNNNTNDDLSTTIKSQLIENEFSFTAKNYNVTIPENSIGKTYVTSEEKIGIYLPLSLQNNIADIKYRIINGDRDKFFKAEERIVGDFCFLLLRTRTGNVDVLNRERKDRYVLQVRGTIIWKNIRHNKLSNDNYEIETTIIVNILDTNDLNPLFYPTKYEEIVSEDTPLHKSILRVIAEDADLGRNGEIYYRFAKESQQFAVHAVSGIITLTRPLRYSEDPIHELTVIAEDRGGLFRGFGGGKSRASTAPVTIRVQQVNLYAPEIYVSHLPDIVENSNTDIYAIIRVVDRDDGINGEIESLNIISGDPDGHFKIKKNELKNGEYHIEIADLLDKETSPLGYNLTLHAIDKGTPKRFSYKIIPVHLTDVNDNAPVFSHEIYDVNVPETAPINTPVIKLKVTDADQGKNALVSLEIVGGNEDGEFYVNAETGMLYTAVKLDAEKKAIYTLTVSAVDQGNTGTRKQSSAKVKINIIDANDNDPKFAQSEMTIEIDENKPAGTDVIKVLATDIDSGENSYISYSIDNIEKIPFEIDPFSGLIKTKQILDYETMKRDYLLAIRASDWGLPYRRQTEMLLRIKIRDVNDNRPQFEKIDCMLRVPRYIPIGSEIMTVSAIDLDSDNIINYRIDSTNEDTCFSLDSITGVLSIVCDLSDIPLSDIYVNVTATDGTHFADLNVISVQLINAKKNINTVIDSDNGSNSIGGPFKCRDTGVVKKSTDASELAERNNQIINNERSTYDTLTPRRYRGNVHEPKFIDFPNEIKINESIKIGTNIIQIHAKDRDLDYNGKLVFGISSGDGDSVFSINQETGQLTTIGYLDREKEKEYFLNITVYDLGEPQKSTSKMLPITVLDVNDNAPKFYKTLVSIRIPENILNDTIIYQANATDADLGENSHIIYSLVTETIDFKIDSITGVLSVNGTLDREKQNIYELKIRASDNGGNNNNNNNNEQVTLYSDALIRITIEDINDNPPKFTLQNYSVKIREDVPIWSVVAVVEATDPDENAGGEIEYILSDSMDNEGYFKIDSLSGTVRTIKSLDFEQRPVHTLVIIAKDHGEPSKTSEATLIIEVIDVNENLYPPVFDDSIISSSVFENQPIGSLITTVRATDKDPVGRDSKIGYSIRGGDGIGLFTIDDEGCRLSYMRCTIPTSCDTSNDKLIVPVSGGPSTSSTGDIDHFNFEKNCLFCGEEWNSKTGFLVGRTYMDNRILSMVKLMAHNQDLKGRLRNVNSLLTVKARYHSKCFENTFESDNDDQKYKASFERVCIHLENNPGKGVTWRVLKDLMGDFPLEVRTLSRRLESKYGDDIYILHRLKYDPQFFYKRKNLYWACNSWMVGDKNLGDDEKELILFVASEILREDIKDKKYDIDSYNSPHKFLDTVQTDIPTTLSFFLERLLMSTNEEINQSFLKIQNIAHSIIAAVRPRSFISYLQLALSTYIYRKTGSKLVIDILSKLGVCSSYYHTQLFEASSIVNAPTLDTGNAHIQFVYDNTDHNASTLDGHRTFHCMGGIYVCTPEHEVTCEGKIEKLKKMPTESQLSSINVIEDAHIPGDFQGGLSNITYVDTTNFDFGTPEPLPPAYCAFFFAHYFNIPNFPSWKGYEEILSRDITSYHVSRIICMPFIPHNPSSLSTVYTSLVHAKKMTAEKKQQTCFVTCDQPLYIKGVDLINGLKDHGMDNVQMLLGLFHLVMSYLGALGYIMAGSGIAELFGVAYAPNSVKQILSGHAFARAMRAHMTAFTAMGKIICEQAVKNNEAEYETYIHSFFSDWGTDDAPLAGDFKVDEKIQEMRRKFLDQLSSFKNNGPTAALWVQYFECLMILFQFYEASRLGYWNLHLQAIKQMLPFFHASGHYNYAKSAQIYLQDMEKLRMSMNPEEYRKYTEEAMFTIRRSDKPFGGIWTDMTIEQTLNRFFGTDLIHGRGVTPGVIARYLGAMPTVFPVMEKLEDFCGVETHSSEQHKDLSPARIQRDKEDVEKFEVWLKTHKPFSKRNVLMSLGTGIVGTEDIDCYKASLKGQAGMETMIGKNAEKVSLTNRYRVKNLEAAKSTIHHPEMYKSVDSTILFQRIFEAFYKDDMLTKEALKFELSPFPLSLFDKNGFMRHADKSKLYDVIEKPSSELVSEITSDFSIIVDGGFLLHQITWPHGKSFRTICETYLNYLKGKFRSQFENKRLYIVFDGYNNEYIGVKSYERYRRQEKNVAADFNIDLDTPLTFTQTNFLSNICNKQKFVEMLATYISSQVHVESASEDADTLIVQKALDVKKESSHPVAVVGNDTDLLVLLIAKTPLDEDNIYFQKTVPARKIKILYSISSYRQLKPYILFLHAFSGCDSTSSFHNKGKKKFMQQMGTAESQEIADIFNNPNASVEQINLAAERFICPFFLDKEDSQEDIEEIRYKRFRASSMAMSSSIEDRLSNLPPTKAALHQHAQRVFYQVQRWLGNEMDPTKWGWRRVGMLLIPVMTTDPPAPEEYLRKIKCGCKKKCTGRCACKKAGLRCSRFCKNCEGLSCGNDCVQATYNTNNESEQNVDENIQGESEGSDDEEVPRSRLPPWLQTIIERNKNDLQDESEDVYDFQDF